MKVLVLKHKKTNQRVIMGCLSEDDIPDEYREEYEIDNLPLQEGFIKAPYVNTNILERVDKRLSVFLRERGYYLPLNFSIFLLPQEDIQKIQNYLLAINNALVNIMRGDIINIMEVEDEAFDTYLAE